MGEIAEMMLNGEMDCETGEYLGGGDGYPRTLEGAKKTKTKKKYCCICHKGFKGEQGLKDHKKFKHEIGD